MLHFGMLVYRAEYSLSDRIGRKWVLAWLTVLLAVVSDYNDVGCS